MKTQQPLGDTLLTAQKEDFEKCLSHFKLFKIDCSVFENGDNLALIKCAHKAPFTISLWIQKLKENQNWANSYFEQLKSDAVQLLPSIVLSNKRTLHLYERACIEDFLQYFYYFDHRVEYIYQKNNDKYESIQFLLSWIKNYPFFSSLEAPVSESCDNLSSAYREVSKTIHGVIDNTVPMVDDLKSLFKPLQNPNREKDLMTHVFGNIFFLLALFNFADFQAFGLEEKKVICQQLSPQQKQILLDFQLEE